MHAACAACHLLVCQCAPLLSYSRDGHAQVLDRASRTATSSSRTAAKNPIPAHVLSATGEQQCYVDRRENLRVENGRLILEAARGSWTGVPAGQGALRSGLAAAVH